MYKKCHFFESLTLWAEGGGTSRYSTVHVVAS